MGDLTDEPHRKQSDLAVLRQLADDRNEEAGEFLEFFLSCTQDGQLSCHVSARVG